MGDKQWTTGPITPHPDWFIAILFRQLMGNTVLARNVTSSSPSTTRVYAWCGRAVKGTVVLSYVNTGTEALVISVTGLAVTPHTEYFITAPGAAMSSDVALLNGVPLTVDDNGVLPMYPIQGVHNATPSGGAVTVPPMSVGFIVLEAAGAAECANG